MDPFLRLCGVLDLDGFEIFPHHAFYVREAAVYDLGTRTAAVKRFAIPRSVYDRTSPADKATICHVSAFVHGLSFLPEKGEDVNPLEEFEDFVVSQYRAMKTPAKCFLAYKGGIHEKRLLRKLDIPSLDLEHFGCPKPGDLFTTGGAPFRCAEHEKKKSWKCSVTKVHLFGEWTLKRLEGVARGYTVRVRSDAHVWFDAHPPTSVAFLHGSRTIEFETKEDSEPFF